MMNYFRVILVIILALFVCINSVQAASYYTEPFLGAPHPRALGMGDAYVAAGRDINSVFYNPAGLSYIKGAQLLAINGETLNDVAMTTEVAALSIDREDSTVISIGYSAFNVGSLQISDYVNGVPTLLGTGKYTNQVVFLSYASKFRNNLRYGINFKSYSNELDIKGAPSLDSGFSGKGINVDLGFLYDLNKDIQVGVCAQNIIGDQEILYNNGATDPLEKKLTLGIASHMQTDDRQDITLGVDYEISLEHDVPGLYHGGVEWWFAESLALRGGVKQVHSSGGALGDMEVVTHLTTGLGFKFGGVQIDYSYYPDFGESTDVQHFIALSYIGEDEEPIFSKEGTDNVTITVDEDVPAEPGTTDTTDYAIQVEEQPAETYATEELETVIEEME